MCIYLILFGIERRKCRKRVVENSNFYFIYVHRYYAGYWIYIFESFRIVSSKMVLRNSISLTYFCHITFRFESILRMFTIVRFLFMPDYFDWIVPYTVYENIIHLNLWQRTFLYFIHICTDNLFISFYYVCMYLCIIYIHIQLYEYYIYVCRKTTTRFRVLLPHNQYQG